jgi:hypothetical protein
VGIPLQGGNMPRRLRSRLTYANVMSTIAVFLALATGGAYAANTVFSTDIVDGEVKTADLGANAVIGTKITDGTVHSAEIGDGQVRNKDLAGDAVGSDKIIDAAVGAVDLAPNAVFTSNVADNTLTGADIAESTLSDVPQADKLDGLTRSDLNTKVLDTVHAGPCNPTSTSYINCGPAAAITLIAPSDVLVMLSGGWFGTGTGPDEGDCRLNIDGLLGQPFPFGQNGNEHDAGSRPASLTFSFAHQTLAAGAHSAQLQCREFDGDVQILGTGLIALIRLGT